MDFVRSERSFIAALVFTAALVIAGGFLTVDAFRPSPLQHALMNVEGIIALSFVALLFTPILRTPFLYDDYTHITDASQFTWRSVAHQFGPVTGLGLFFRPVGFFFYWLNYLLARANPVWWHLSSIALHAA